MAALVARRTGAGVAHDGVVRRRDVAFRSVFVEHRFRQRGTSRLATRILPVERAALGIVAFHAEMRSRSSDRGRRRHAARYCMPRWSDADPRSVSQAAGSSVRLVWRVRTRRRVEPGDKRGPASWTSPPQQVLLALDCPADRSAKSGRCALDATSFDDVEMETHVASSVPDGSSVPDPTRRDGASGRCRRCGQSASDRGRSRTRSCSRSRAASIGDLNTKPSSTGSCSRTRRRRR